MSQILFTIKVFIAMGSYVALVNTNVTKFTKRFRGPIRSMSQ